MPGSVLGTEDAASGEKKKKKPDKNSFPKGLTFERGQTSKSVCTLFSLSDGDKAIGGKKAEKGPRRANEREGPQRR